MGNVFEIHNLDLFYGTHQALHAVSMAMKSHAITAIIGPSGCGKSSLLRCLNRMNDLVAGVRVKGEILFKGQNIYAAGADPMEIRYHIGMVFQKPNPFPKTIYENVAFGPRINGHRGSLDELVERCLRQAALWDEVKDRLQRSALGLSGGQQQRLCLARALAVEPEVILMDEPASALDPISTAKLEDLMAELKSRYSIILVTHNMQQAARVSDETALFLDGRLIEQSPTQTIFSTPRDQRTEDYITGRFG
jgi:phosphate transport system ATP-binding protein